MHALKEKIAAVQNNVRMRYQKNNNNAIEDQNLKNQCTLQIPDDSELDLLYEKFLVIFFF
jgi:hypothetical protein